MIKTNTPAKKSPTKKTPVKPSVSKTVPVVAPKKSVEKKTATVSQKANVVPKKTTPKKTVTKKVPVKKLATQIAHKTIVKTPVKKLLNSSPEEGVKLLGILHLAANLLSGGTLGIIVVILYYFVQKNKISSLEKETCFEIINFNLSFLIYAFISFVLMFVLVGFLFIPVVFITWFVLLIVGFLKHVEGENYTYPFVIRFVS